MSPEQTNQFANAVARLIGAASGEGGYTLNESVIRSGLLLLWLARESNGYLNLSHDEAMLVCDTNKNGTMRRHLIALQKAQVLQCYSTNGTVRMKFAGYPGREMIVHQRGSGDDSVLEIPNSVLEIPNSVLEIPTTDNEYYSSDPGARLRALQYLLRAHQSHPSRNFDHYTQGDHVVVGSTTTPSEKKVLLPTNPDALEQAQSVSLLLDTDVRSKPKDAYRLAKLHPFLLIREAIGHWWCNRRSRGGKFDETPGIVTHWLDNLENFTIPALSTEFLQSDIYSRHRTKEEMSVAPQIVEETAAVVDDDDTLDEWVAEPDLWNRTLAGLELPAIVKTTWLSNVTLWRNGGSTFCIELPAHQLDHVESRFRTALRRALATQCGIALAALKLTIVSGEAL